MSTRDDIKKEIEEDQKNSSGEEEVGGSNVGLEKDDDTNKAFADVFQHEPKEGETIADELDPEEEENE